MNQEIEELIERWPLIKDFDLPNNANIVVVGAYKGLAMEALANLYPTYRRIEGFEPQEWACLEARERLKNYPSVHVSMVGLGTALGQIGPIPMGEWHTDACSFVNVGEGSRQQGEGYMMNADEGLTFAVGVNRIQLMVINIEGYEYELLPYLSKTGWLKRIDRLAVQWHLGLGSNPKDSYDMDDAIDKLLLYGKYKLVRDERPAWTYMEPAWVGGDA